MPAPAPTFVDVTAEAKRADTVEARNISAVAAADAFEVALVSGTRIRLPLSFEPGALRALFTALEGR